MVRDDVQDYLKKEFEEEEFQRKREELQKVKFDFPEYYQFLDKFEKNNEIQHALNQYTNLKDIKGYLYQAEQQNLQSGLVQRLKQKIQKSEEIKEKIGKIVESQKIGDEDIKELKGLKEQIDNLKLYMDKEDKTIFNCQK